MRVQNTCFPKRMYLSHILANLNGQAWRGKNYNDSKRHNLNEVIVLYTRSSFVSSSFLFYLSICIFVTFTGTIFGQSARPTPLQRTSQKQLLTNSTAELEG